MRNITFKQLIQEYETDFDRKLVNVTDSEIANSFYHSKMSVSWGNRQIDDTNWHVISTPSPRTKDDIAYAYVCESKLLKE